MSEQWKKHPRLPFLVSNEGHVQSISRRVRTWQGSRVFKSKLLKTTMRGGRKSISLKANGVRYDYSVSRLVLETWKGPCPEGMECCHNDGNPSNDHVNNLRWDTHQSNMDDQITHGTRNTGSQVYCAKLDNPNEQVPLIHRLYNSGLSESEVAARFNMQRESVRAILDGKTYKASQPPIKERATKRSSENYGEKNGRALLRSTDIPNIRSAHQAGESVSSIARRYGINWSAISRVVKGISWKHV